jgi:hypothetical protein
MNTIKDLFITIFSSGPYSAMFLMLLIVIFFGYIALTAKIVKEKPHSRGK